MTPSCHPISSEYSRVWIRASAPILMALLGPLAGPVGCESVQLTKPLAIFNTRHDVRADWDDTDPSVEVALHQVQMALDHKERNDADTERRYILLTHTDEPAILILRREQAIENGFQTITLEAHVGRFGDPDREDRLVRSVRHRLKSLAGVDHAPVTLPPS